MDPAAPAPLEVPTKPPAPVVPADSPTVESLIEDISIDGMCGVY